MNRSRGHALSLRPARPEDLDWISTWLSREALPIADLTPALMANFYTAERDGTLVGIAGLEAFARNGLLRSVVIDRECRGEGLGAELIAELENVARNAGIDQLWLLTIDAADFFKVLGFTVADRGTAPIAVQATSEFAKLCPGDAVLMCKLL